MQINYVFIVCFHGPRCNCTAAFLRVKASALGHAEHVRGAREMHIDPGMGDIGTEVTRQNEDR